MNALTKATGTTLSTNAEAEHLINAAREDGFEKLLKFKDGEYFIGEEQVPRGTEYVAHAIGWTKAWIKFVDNKVAERKIYRVSRGERPPEREDLDDLDKTKWPDGLDGKPADPWVLQYLLPFESTSGEIVIFVTRSFGGRRAVADLCAAYGRRAAQNQGCGQPIIKLGKADMPTKYGKKPRPLFEIVSWNETDCDGEPARLATAPDGAVGLPPAAVAQELDDEIPF